MTIANKKQWDLVLGCNLQSLSYFRITLSILLTTELLLRYKYLHAFYSDEGTLPTYILTSKIDTLYKILCIHNYNGALIYQQVLLGIQVLVGISLGLGYKTNVCAIVSWILYLSLTLRNTWLAYILDRYIHYLLFYCMLLPVSEVNSIDSYDHTSKKKNNTSNTKCQTVVISAATICVKLQILWIYLDAGIGKYLDPNSGWSLNASPLPALDTYARHTIVSRYLYAALTPVGLRYLTPTVVYIELGVVPLALLASYFGKIRVLKVAIFLICSLHIGIAFTLKNTMLLSSVACVSWWLYYHPTLLPSSSSYFITRKQNYLQLCFLLPFISGSIWLEQYSNECTQSMEHIWSTLLHNRWNVFTGAEEYVTWEIAPGRLQNGMIVDVWSNAYNVSWSMPGTEDNTIGHTRKGRWRSYPYLADFESSEEKLLTWNYLCKQWDMEHRNLIPNGYSLKRFNFFMLQADVLPNMGFSETRKRLIHSHVCNTSSTSDAEFIPKETENGIVSRQEEESSNSNVRDSSDL